MPTTYVKKDGTISVYDKKKYNENYRAKHIDGYTCITCNRKMNVSQIKNHELSTYHKKRISDQDIQENKLLCIDAP